MLPDNSLNKLNLFFSQHKCLNFKKRDVILHADENPEYVYFIKTGYVRAYRISEQGEELTLVILESQEVFPITYGLNNMPNTYYLEAITTLEVWQAPKEQFLTFLKINPDIFYELTNHVLVRFGYLLTRMEYLIISRAYTKVAATILMCAKRFGEQKGTDIVVKIPFTHKDIATLAGITRETTCLEMKKLEEKGLVSRHGRLLVIKNLEKLEEESLLNESDGSLLNYSI